MTDTAHEAYDLLMRLNEALPGAVMDAEGVASALNTLDDALTEYQRANDVSTGDLMGAIKYVIGRGSETRGSALASYLEIPSSSVSMARTVSSPANGGCEFTITVGTKQFLLSIASNNGMG